jgi:hypothetical protein
MAANPFGGLLLQPTCKALTQLHQLVFGSLLGTLFLSATGYSTADELCHDMPSAARLLVWHAWAVQSVLVPALTMFHLEWRLKRKFVRTHCGSELRLSPAWLRPLPAARRWSGATHHTQQHSAGCAWGRLQAAVVRPVMLVPLLGLLWSVLVLVLRRLPMAPCETCADTGTCVRAAPCGKRAGETCLCWLRCTCPTKARCPAVRAYTCLTRLPPPLSCAAVAASPLPPRRGRAVCHARGDAAWVHLRPVRVWLPVFDPVAGHGCVRRASGSRRGACTRTRAHGRHQFCTQNLHRGWKPPCLPLLCTTQHLGLMHTAALRPTHVYRRCHWLPVLRLALSA